MGSSAPESAPAQRVDTPDHGGTRVALSRLCRCGPAKEVEHSMSVILLVFLSLASILLALSLSYASLKLLLAIAGSRG